MALNYTGTTIGTLTLCQPVREKQGDQYVEKKDEKGRTVYNKYKLQIRESNSMACFLHIYKIVNLEEPKKCWMHDLIMFFANEEHLKNCMKEYESNAFEHIFFGKLTNIKLNIYYKEMLTLAKYMTRDGLEVICYYDNPKKK